MSKLRFLLILALLMSLILFLPGCGLLAGNTDGDQTEKPGHTDENNSDETERPYPTDEETQDPNNDPGTGNKDVDEILKIPEKASSYQNYYSEFTYTMYQHTESWKVWYKEPIMNTLEENGIRVLLDFDAEVQIFYDDTQGDKSELNHDFAAKYSGYSMDILKTLLTTEEYAVYEIKDETINGRDCMLIHITTFEDTVYKYYFDKENGFLLKYDAFDKGDYHVIAFERTVLEFDTVTDDDIKLPEGVVVE